MTIIHNAADLFSVLAQDTNLSPATQAQVAQALLVSGFLNEDGTSTFDLTPTTINVLEREGSIIQLPPGKTITVLENGSTDPSQPTVVRARDGIIAIDDKGTGEAVKVVDKGKAAETLVGGTGNDTLSASGHVLVLGGSGDQVLTSTPKNGNAKFADTLWAGTGNDTIIGSGKSDIAGDVSGGSDTIYGGYRADPNNPGQVSGVNQNAADTIFAGTGDNTIYLGAGNNLVYGNVGHATITAGSGHDTIFAGSGAESIIGGGHTEIFAGNHDTITSTGADTITGGRFGTTNRVDLNGGGATVFGHDVLGSNPNHGGKLNVHVHNSLNDSIFGGSNSDPSNTNVFLDVSSARFNAARQTHDSQGNTQIHFGNHQVLTVNDVTIHTSDNKTFIIPGNNV